MIKKIISAVILVLTATSIIAQTKTTTVPNKKTDMCELLKKENEALKASLNINLGVSKQTANDVDFTITKVIGNLKTQVITIEFLLTNKMENRMVQISKNPKLVIIEGDVFRVTNSSIAGDIYESNAFLNTDVPIKCSYTFPPILPTNKYIKLLSFGYIVNPQDYNKKTEGLMEFRDLEITWK